MSRLLSILSLWILASPVCAAAATDILFQSADVIDITLNGPFEEIDDERDKEPEYEGTVSYVDADGTKVVLDVSLKVRGNWRLEKANCRYAQLWLNFKRGQVAGTIFENQNRLKLVLQCGRHQRYVDYLIKELQAYTVFSEISELHFGTRLFNVTYIDSEDPESTRTHLAFFIEHHRRLAQRFNFSEVELNGINSTELEPVQSTMVSLFMLMIANTDYSVLRASEGEECCHNSKLLRNDSGEYVVLPYDFDSSGFVNTNYAALPDAALGIKSNRRRLYRGFCVPPETLNSAIGRIQDLRNRINTIIGDTTYISQRTANRSLSYIENFFEILDDPRKTNRQIIRACRG